MEIVHNDVSLNEVHDKEINDEEISAEVKSTQLNENYQDCCQSEEIHLLVNRVKTLEEFVVNNMGNNFDLFLDTELFLKSLKVMDVVTCKSTRTSCFTKK